MVFIEYTLYWCHVEIFEGKLVFVFFICHCVPNKKTVYLVLVFTRLSIHVRVKNQTEVFA